ncbi:hypothetical protein KFK09_015115 [Dendrobium nobile]|uniref:Uncharacterized protein n=1 Tax=Dendrobium nobile TaxID=94219 RepID=A0A8T3B9M9_DENNO|nr:hypothetical protein KFK09_015115 [Dendrobium nobile]
MLLRIVYTLQYKVFSFLNGFTLQYVTLLASLSLSLSLSLYLHLASLALFLSLDCHIFIFHQEQPEALRL